MGNPKRSRTVTLLLVLLPLWLVGSGGGALWYYFHKQKTLALVEQERFAQAVSVPLIADDLRKIVEVIGERNTASPTAAANLSRTASMIEGLLGPGNSGYTVKKSKGPADWPILQVTLAGKSPEAPAVWVLTPYDSRPGSRGAETNATGLAATLAAAQALARDQPAVPVHFVFLPHWNESGNEGDLGAKAVEKTVPRIQPFPAKPASVLCVESMGAGETLWLMSRDPAAPALTKLSGLGAVHQGPPYGPCADVDLASWLTRGASVSAVRVATRQSLEAIENDDRPPFAPTVAASAGRLIELIRRCAEK